MERNQTQLEAQAGEEEHHGKNLQRASGEHRGHVFEIHGSACSVDERQAVKHEGGREHGVQDELGAGFRAVVTVFVECNQACHRDAGKFQAYVEEEEAARAYHVIHTQQGGEGQDVEFACLVAGVFTVNP